MTYNMKEHKEKGVDLGLRQFIKSLGYVALAGVFQVRTLVEVTLERAA